MSREHLYVYRYRSDDIGYQLYIRVAYAMNASQVDCEAHTSLIICPVNRYENNGWQEETHEKISL